VSLVLDTSSTDVVVSEVVDTVMRDMTKGDYTVAVGEKDGSKEVLIKTRLGTDDEVAVLTNVLQTTLVSKGVVASEDGIKSLSIIGPSIGDYMKKSARDALIVGILLMAVYMIFSFASIRTVISPAVLAIVTVITMLFDVSIPSGAYGLLMSLNQTVQIDTIFIIAILTTIGYSINDTIIIMDRVRENTLKHQSHMVKK